MYQNFTNFKNKIKQIEQAYDEISKLNEFLKFQKSDKFYQKCEEIINNNIIQRISKFKDKIYYDFKQFSEGE